MNTQWKHRCINITISFEPTWNKRTIYCVLFIFVNGAVPYCITERAGGIRNCTYWGETHWTNGGWNCSLRCKNKERWQSITVFTLIPALTNNLWSPLLLSLFYRAQLLLALSLLFLLFFYFFKLSGWAELSETEWSTSACHSSSALNCTWDRWHQWKCAGQILTDNVWA